MRWEILKGSIGCSLHGLSDTRWSARIDAVKPFANNLGGLRQALKEISVFNLTAETRSDLNGILKYLNSFECLILSNIWFKVLTAIDYRNKILQNVNATIDIEESNINSLIFDLKNIREKWSDILTECKIVAENLKIDFNTNSHGKRRKFRKRFADEINDDNNDTEITGENYLKTQVFYKILDFIIGSLTWRYGALKEICGSFGFLWNYLKTDDDSLIQSSNDLCNKYTSDIAKEISDEIIHLKTIHQATFGENQLLPINLLNKMKELRIDAVFPNICIALRIFCTIPVTVAQAERSFSTLARVKNVLRSTMCQNRLNSLGTLAIEGALAREIDFENVIKCFANKKARKALLN